MNNMDKVRNVAVIVGSLRKDSINRKVANALADLAPTGLKLSIIEIGQLPIYNQVSDGTRKFLQGFMKAYATWIATITGAT